MSRRATDDPFELFGLRRSFRVGLAELRRTHLALAASAHPDRAGSAVAAADAARRSAVVNEAFRVLADPIQRAEAILGLEGIGGTGETAPMPPTFLADMLEWREAIDEARSVRDAARLSGLRDDALERRNASLESLAACFDAGLAATGDARRARLIEARDRLAVLRYLERALTSLATTEGDASQRDSDAGGRRDEGLGP